jgi:carbamoyl-phosphate synthase large subunit
VTLSDKIQKTIIAYTEKLALKIGVKGLLNVQYVIDGDDVLVIEANPRASRTIPYLSKAIGVPLAKYAALIASGKTLAELNFTEMPVPSVYSVKEAVLPFLKFRNFLPILAPEMRSTGESMGIDANAHVAFYKAQLGANVVLPTAAGSNVLLIGEADDLTEQLAALGFTLMDMPSDPAALPAYDLLIDLEHTAELRNALENGVAYVTTHEAARATLNAIASVQQQSLTVNALQGLHPELAKTS